MNRTVWLTSILSLFLAGRCLAQVDPWEFEVYPYATTGRGVAELETSNAVVVDGHQEPGEGTANGTFASHHTWYNAYELDYGLTDRIEIAGYATFAQPNGRPLQWAGSKFHVRGRLFDEDELPLNLGWYVEIEAHKTPQFDDAHTELELQPIIEKDIGRVMFLLNPKFEKVLSGEGRHQGFEFGYAAAVKYRWKRQLSPGVEFYGGAGLINQPDPRREQQHYVFPTLSGELGHGFEYNIGIGYGLTPGSDRLIFKIGVELEHYVRRARSG